MSEAKAKAEARKKKILERGSDRMAIATGQKSSGESSSWRKRRGRMTNDKMSATCKSQQLQYGRDESGADGSNGSDQDQADAKKSCSDLDRQLDDIVKNISVDDLNSNTNKSCSPTSDQVKCCQSVLEASSNYNPMQSKEARAKRKALEKEVVKQTEEFDRLAAIARERKKNVSNDSNQSNELLEKSDNTPKRASGATTAFDLSWLGILKILVLVTLGFVIGYKSTLDTAAVKLNYPTAVDSYITDLLWRRPTTVHNQILDEVHDSRLDLLNDFSNSWQKTSSSIYIVMHHPMVVVAFVSYLFRILESKKTTGGAANNMQHLLQSLLSIVTGDFSGVTSPLKSFFGDVCVYILAIVATAAYYQY